jgi:hypothetical protein
LAIGDWRLAIDDWVIDGLAIGDWRLAIGDWRLAIGDWRLAIGDCRFDLTIVGDSSIAIGNPQSAIGNRQSAIGNGIANRQFVNRQSAIGNPSIGSRQSPVANCYNSSVQMEDVERIARGALRDLGVPDAVMTVAADEERPDAWRIEVAGARGSTITLTIRGGRGSSAQWIREQIFTQFQAGQK